MNYDTYTLDDFMTFLLDQIESPANRLRKGIELMLSYSGHGASAHQLSEKARALMWLTSFKNEEFWANWMIMKAPPTAAEQANQNMMEIKTLQRATDHIRNLMKHPGSNPSSNLPNSSKPRSFSSGTKRPADDSAANPPKNSRDPTSKPPKNVVETQKKEGRCFNCNEKGHRTRHCPNKASDQGTGATGGSG